MNAEIIAFNEQNSVNQLNYRHNQSGINTVTEDFQSYLSSFEDKEKMPLQNHPFVQKQQGKFHNATSKYEMRHFIVCCESLPTSVNMHVTLGIYKCIQCKRDKHQSPQFSPQNDMIPLTLSSGTVQELINFTDATPLEFMLVAISCPIMRIVCHTS